MMQDCFEFFTKAKISICSIWPDRVELMPQKLQTVADEERILVQGT